MAAGGPAEVGPDAQLLDGTGVEDRRRRGGGGRRGDRRRDEPVGLVEAGRARRPVGGDAVEGAVGALLGSVATVGIGGVGGGGEDGQEGNEHRSLGGEGAGVAPKE